MVWFTAISLSPSRQPFYPPKTWMNLNDLWTNESLSSVLRIASFLQSPVFVAYLATLSQQIAAVVQPCQDQVELHRKKEKSWQKQRCLLQWQIPNWRLWCWDSSLYRGRMETGGVTHQHNYCCHNHYYASISTAPTYSRRCMKVFRKRMRAPLMCQRKYERSRVLMNITFRLQPLRTRVWDTNRGTRRESRSRRWSKIQGDVIAGDR